MTDANSRQIGGSHYKCDLQHWDIMTDYGVSYLEACTTKYVTRAFKKNGLEDLKKASHYLEKMLEKVKTIGYKPRLIIVPSNAVLEQYAQENALDKTQDEIIRILVSRWTPDQLIVAQGLVQILIHQLESNMTIRIDNTGQQHPFGYQPELDEHA